MYMMMSASLRPDGQFETSDTKKPKEKFTLCRNHDGSLLRRQLRAMATGHSPSTHQTQFRNFPVLLYLICKKHNRNKKMNRSKAALSSSRCDSPEVAHILKGVGVVDGDGVAIHRRKVVPAMAEAALLASLHTELLDQPVSMLTLLSTDTAVTCTFCRCRNNTCL